MTVKERRQIKRGRGKRRGRDESGEEKKRRNRGGG